MSRALEKEVLENLRSEDPKAVYKSIAGLLAHPPQDGSLLEIELLGKAHPLEAGVNFLQDGNAIAIPKLRLVQAFFVARHILQEHLASHPESPSRDTVAATAVILLMDPEHVTAANIRKRAVLSRLKGGDARESVLGEEKQFLDSLLTAHLHRHTKSPTLWNHRRWLMERFISYDVSFDTRKDLVTVIMVAADRHPKNYYAWHHARRLVRDLLDQQPQAELLGAVVDDVKAWCFGHHNDISGWSYLNFVIASIEDSEARGRKCTSVLTETLARVDSLRWANESVWVFLRTAVATQPVSEEVLKTFSDLDQNLPLAAREDRTRHGR
jgi:protein prenyltransferase alpha subunit repeat containing protein 1